MEEIYPRTFLKRYGFNVFIIKCPLCGGKGRYPQHSVQIQEDGSMVSSIRSESCLVCEGKRALKVEFLNNSIRCPGCNGTGHDPTHPDSFIRGSSRI